MKAKISFKTFEGQYDKDGYPIYDNKLTVVETKEDKNRKERQKVYYQKNKEKINKRKRKWHKEYYKKNRKHILKKMKERNDEKRNENKLLNKNKEIKNE